MLKRNPLLQERVRSLRNSLTDAENVLWQALKARQINGFKFRRQYIFQNYIVDFISLSHKLIIEKVS
jgi:very-short-patch-repair endonuclease